MNNDIVAVLLNNHSLEIMNQIKKTEYQGLKLSRLLKKKYICIHASFLRFKHRVFFNPYVY